MSIPESQLETWGNQGSTVTSQRTHKAIRKALEAETSPVRDRKIEIFLQGSYRNSTNTYGESDVDVVVMLQTVWQRDISSLNEIQKGKYNSWVSKSEYGHPQLRADVQVALEKYFGEDAVDPDEKCLKLARGDNRLPADIVPCLQYRKYLSFESASDQEFVDGIVFYTTPGGRRIINYPKLHYRNGAAKNARERTGASYRKMTRVFKNARNRIVANTDLEKDDVSSYFLECLLYNVPDDRFLGTLQESYRAIVDWLSSTKLSSFECQNEQLPLFGETPEQWNVADARKLIDELVSLWNDW